MYIPCKASSWTLLHQNRKLSSRISLQNQLFCLCRLPAVIRALKRKIVNLEDTKSYTAKEEINCTSSNSTTYDTNNQSLLQDIHKKVTNYILKQVDIQIQKLDVDENGQKWSRNKQNNEDRKENNQDLEQTNQEQQRRNHNEIGNHIMHQDQI